LLPLCLVMMFQLLHVDRPHLSKQTVCTYSREEADSQLRTSATTVGEMALPAGPEAPS